MTIKKILIILANLIGTGIITFCIVFVLNSQGEKRRIFASNSLDRLKNSVLSLLPDEPVPFVEDTGSDKNSLTIEEETSSIKEVESKKVAASAENKASTTSFTQRPEESKSAKVLKYNKPDKVRELSIITVESPYIGRKLLENKEIDSEARRKPYKTEIDFNIKNIDELISKSITLAINEFDVDEDIMLLLSDQLKNAEKYFDIEDIDIEEITYKTKRVALLSKLQEKALDLGRKMGAEKECNYHKPVFAINERLEITGIYPNYDCHPELADKIIAAVKKLPEYKKLVKRKR